MKTLPDQALFQQLGLDLDRGQRCPELMAGHAQKVILAPFQFFARGIVQHKADALEHLAMKGHAAHQHVQAAAILTHEFGLKGCGILLHDQFLVCPLGQRGL